MNNDPGMRALRRGAVCLAAVLFTSACSTDPPSLLQSINAYRTTTQTCNGKRFEALGPLAPSAALAKVDLGLAKQSLNDALARVGYSASAAQAVVLSGPSTLTGSAMKVLKDRYCEVLLSGQFSEIGISRDGMTWRLVFAQPLLARDLGDWREAGLQVLRLVNEARGHARTCGTQQFQPAAPVEWNATLASAALHHSTDMAKRNYFAHKAPDGRVVDDRAAAAGYDWQHIAENIAAGQGSPAQAVAGWLASPNHCVNVMGPEFTEMGAAYAINQRSDTRIYWAQVLGGPRR